MYQLVRRGNKWYLRAAPYTILFPTEAQIRHRREFARIAKRYKGLKGFDPATGLPIVAAKLAEELRGKRWGARPRPPKWLRQAEARQSLRLDTLRHRIARAIAAQRLKALA